MRFKLSSLGLLAIFLFALAFPWGAEAASESDVFVNTIPENPTPYEDTSINLDSYATNLDGVLISWSVDGKNVLSGIGKRSLSVKAPAPGSVSTIVANIAFPEGTLQKRIIIRPTVMALLWQANDSYVPPFYRGKALPSPESSVKVVAMPEIRTSAGISISPTNMTYAWEKDYTNDQGASGYGRNFFTYVNDYLDKSNTISVTASTIDGQSSSDASINIGTIQPKISFYKSDPGIGTMWETAIMDFHRIQNDEIVVAIPYFISPKEIQNPTLSWSWFINDTPVGISGSRKNMMPLKAPEGTSGTSKLRLNIENVDKIFQSTSKEISIEF